MSEIKVLYVGQSNDTGALVFTPSLIEANKRLMQPFTHYVHGDDHFKVITELQTQFKDAQTGFNNALSCAEHVETQRKKLENDLKMCREIGVEMQREVNRKQTLEVRKLEQRLAEAETVVKFYGDKKKYQYKEHPDGLEGRGDFPIMQDDGRKANEYLTKWGVK